MAMQSFFTGFWILLLCYPGFSAEKTFETDPELEKVVTALFDGMRSADGDLATAWMEYRFYYMGEFSHCGVNSMNLIRKNNGWKIFSIVDTRRQEGCDGIK